jgi:hypothetical protein
VIDVMRHGVVRLVNSAILAILTRTLAHATLDVRRGHLAPLCKSEIRALACRKLRKLSMRT